VKAALELYDAKRQKADGMLVRKVEAVIKKKYKGVGPSHATIHHYVANLGLIGTSPVKTGPQGTVPPLNYGIMCCICILHEHPAGE
jgi:hypothetical protein